MSKVKTIVGKIGCSKCLVIKNKLKDAEYKLLSSFDETTQSDLLKKAEETNNLNLPILLDKDGNIISHKEIGF